MANTYKARIAIHDSQLIGDEDYSFNCHVTDGGLTADDAWNHANEIAEVLVGTVLPPNCTINRVSIYNKTVVNGIQNRIVSLVGTRTVTGLPLPGWNVCLVQGSASAGARVHSWHLRVGLTEDDVDGQSLVAGMNTALAAFVSGILIGPLIVDKDGAAITDWRQSDIVHMRQMSWNRRKRPGFKRGYVPV